MQNSDGCWTDSRLATGYIQKMRCVEEYEHN